MSACCQKETFFLQPLLFSACSFVPRLCAARQVSAKGAVEKLPPKATIYTAAILKIRTSFFFKEKKKKKIRTSWSMSYVSLDIRMCINSILHCIALHWELLLVHTLKMRLVDALDRSGC